MKRNITFSVLIIAFFTQIIIANAEDIQDIEISMFGRERVTSPLVGKEIVVRIYKDWKSSPGKYNTYTILYERLSKSPEIYNGQYYNPNGSSVMVIVEEDQTDEQVKSAISGSAIAERYDKLKENIFFFTAFGRETKEKENIFIDDALGELISNSKVDIFIKDSDTEGAEILLASIEVKNGLVQIPQISGSIRNVSFAVSNPDYGTTVVRRSFNTSHIRTPLVHKESQAYQRAIRGRVVDPDGNPLEGAVIECTNVRTLGEGLINSLNGDTAKSITDKNGEFCLYLPNEQNDERGYLIPPGSTYHTRIEAPKETGLLPYVDPIMNDTEQLIVMEKADHFRTFIFSDENGIITDYSRLQSININIERSGKRMLRIGYSELKDGGYFPLGEYKANMYVSGDGEYEFEPVIVDENSPEVIVMKLPEHVIYSGQVVHGLTGQPIPGAFVMAFNSSSKGNLSMITKEQWQALHVLPLEPELDDPAIKPVTDIYGIKKIVRTDEQGHFQMSFIPGEIYGFITFEKDYLAVQHRRHKLVPDERRIAQIPAIKLYPAATVVVNLQTEERISVNPNWIINEKDNPGWTREFLAQDDKSEREYVAYRRWLEQNKIQSFHIPANLNVQIKLETPYDEQWCPIEVPDLLNLAQGQTIDLGSFIFEPAVEIFVQVINSKGQPVEGIPIRTVIKENYWGLAHNSDESGISSFYVNPGSSVQFGITYYGQDGKYMRKIISCDVKGQEDAGKLLTMQLSDEILERLFDIGKRI